MNILGSQNDCICVFKRFFGSSRAIISNSVTRRICVLKSEFVHELCADVFYLGDIFTAHGNVGKSTVRRISKLFSLSESSYEEITIIPKKILYEW